MKKLLTLFIISLLLSSCREVVLDYNETLIITGRETKNDVICLFRTNAETDDVNLFSDIYRSFKDSCSKYNIGDTIKLTK